MELFVEVTPRWKRFSFSCYVHLTNLAKLYTVYASSIIFSTASWWSCFLSKFDYYFQSFLINEFHWGSCSFNLVGTDIELCTGIKPETVEILFKYQLVDIFGNNIHVTAKRQAFFFLSLYVDYCHALSQPF